MNSQINWIKSWQYCKCIQKLPWTLNPRINPREFGPAYLTCSPKISTHNVRSWWMPASIRWQCKYFTNSNPLINSQCDPRNDSCWCNCAQRFSEMSKYCFFVLMKIEIRSNHHQPAVTAINLNYFERWETVRAQMMLSSTLQNSYLSTTLARKVFNESVDLDWLKVMLPLVFPKEFILSVQRLLQSLPNESWWNYYSPYWVF